MAKPKRWPENVNAARQAAVDAAETTIDALIEATACLVKGNTDGALEQFKRAIRLQNYIVRVLDRAKDGQAPDPMPGEIGEKPKQ